MQIDRRVTNGLAWAGVLLVVGIPTADILSAQFLGDPTPAPTAQIAVVERIAPVPAPLSQRPAAPVAKPQTQVAASTPAKPVVVAPAAKPAVQAAAVTPAKPAVQTAAAVPAKPAVAAPVAATPATGTADAVNAWLDSGKPLPSYITGEPSTDQPTQAAATPPARAPIVTTPAATPSDIDPVQVASIQQPKVAPTPMPLSMRPAPVAVVRPPAGAVPVTIVGPNNDLVVATPGTGPRPPADVTAQELEDWESGPLAEFLAERQGSRAEVSYDDDGFFLDEGPNRQPRRRDRVIGPVDDFFFPFFE